MSQVKGTLVGRIIERLRASGDADSADLPDPLRHYLQSGALIAATQWYPFADYFGLIKVLIGREPPPPAGQNIYAYLGAQSARENFQGTYKDLIVPGNMAESLASMANIWKFLLDTADASTEVTGPSRAHFDVVGFTGGNREFCMILTGFVGVCPELVGFKDGGAIKTRCVHDGDDRCRWDMSWTPDD